MSYLLFLDNNVYIIEVCEYNFIFIISGKWDDLKENIR